MAVRQGRQLASGREAGQRQKVRQSVYIEGNTARQMDVKRVIEQEPRRQLSHTVRKNREKASHMSLGYVSFLVCALLVAGFVLLNYVQLQFDITNKIEYIASLECELNNLKQANEEAYTQITSSVNLEEIKSIAIGELGMTYATEGQVITYANEGSDYLRQYADIP